MASSTRKMGDKLGESSQDVSHLQQFSHAIVHQNIAEIFASYQTALRGDFVVALPALVKKALQVVQEKDKDNLLTFHDKLLGLALNDAEMPTQNTQAILQGIDTYLEEVISKNLLSTELLAKLLAVAIESTKNKVAVAVFHEKWIQKDNAIFTKEKDPAPAPILPPTSAPEPTPVSSDWSLSGGLQYVWDQLSWLKSQVVYYEKEIDDEMLKPSPNNSPRSSW
jgi:hypothetical protein